MTSTWRIRTQLLVKSDQKIPAVSKTARSPRLSEGNSFIPPDPNLDYVSKLRNLVQARLVIFTLKNILKLKGELQKELIADLLIYDKLVNIFSYDSDWIYACLSGCLW